MTLEEYCRTFFKKKEFDSPLLKSLIEIYGREKIEGFYQTWKQGLPPTQKPKGVSMQDAEKQSNSNNRRRDNYKRAEADGRVFSACDKSSKAFED